MMITFPAATTLTPTDGETVFDTVQGETPARDTVGEAADGGAEVGVPSQIGLEGIEAQHDVGETTVPVRHQELRQGGAIGRHPDLHPVLIPDRVEVDRETVSGLAEASFPDDHPSYL
jgi:hypothetical protein